MGHLENIEHWPKQRRAFANSLSSKRTGLPKVRSFKHDGMAITNINNIIETQQDMYYLTWYSCTVKTSFFIQFAEGALFIRAIPFEILRGAEWKKNL